jgi:hypothetical protein
MRELGTVGINRMSLVNDARDLRQRRKRDAESTKPYVALRPNWFSAVEPSTCVVLFLYGTTKLTGADEIPAPVTVSR